MKREPWLYQEKAFEVEGSKEKTPRWECDRRGEAIERG